MRYPAAEKLEIIRLVEQSSLSVRRHPDRSVAREPRAGLLVPQARQRARQAAPAFTAPR